ncbi:dienelactone hydrolase family protein [Niabella sp. CJ426]|uniref:dienelactone hydrolase family protein n=1 Tax=Niabella sp. CJ426 TaxID=3393740 RepID=UPI003D08E8D7
MYQLVSNYIKHLFASVILLITIGGYINAQQGLSESAAEAIANKALVNAFKKQQSIAEREWGPQNNKIEYNGYTMIFDFKVTGKMPADGRCLFISLHGGGQGPKEVNDQQWMNQHQLYSPREGVYLVPRAPTDTWNLWHEDHIDTMLERIVRNAIVMEGVNPDKVYLMGYSAGGDGVYQLASRMADRWAAAAMMAGHPGDAAILNLYNLPFSIYVGGMDAAYDRNKLAANWGKQLDSLERVYPDGYKHEVHIYPDMPHWMNRKDTVAITWLAQFKRNPLPSRITWVQDDRTHNDFYWLTSTKPLKEDTVIAQIKNNTIEVLHNDAKNLYINLNDRLLNLDEKVSIVYDGKRIFHKKLKRSAMLINESIEKSLDAKKYFSAQILIKKTKKQNKYTVVAE